MNTRTSRLAAAAAPAIAAATAPTPAPAPTPTSERTDAPAAAAPPIAPADAPAAPPETPTDDAAPVIPARILRAHLDYQIDEVVELDEDTIEMAVADGWADPDPAAVAYARALAA